MAQTMWDGHLWTVTQTATQWVLSRSRKGRMTPIEERVMLTDASTVADVCAVLSARSLAKLEAERSSITAARMPAHAISQQTSTVHRPVKTLSRCPRCRTTGYAGEYPFSTGYSNNLCDDCGG